MASEPQGWGYKHAPPHSAFYAGEQTQSFVITLEAFDRLSYVSGFLFLLLLGFFEPINLLLRNTMLWILAKAGGKSPGWTMFINYTVSKHFNVLILCLISISVSCWITQTLTFSSRNYSKLLTTNNLDNTYLFLALSTYKFCIVGCCLNCVTSAEEQHLIVRVCLEPSRYTHISLSFFCF